MKRSKKSKPFCVVEYAARNTKYGLENADVWHGCFHKKINALRKCQAIRKNGGRCFVLGVPAKGARYAVTNLKGHQRWEWEARGR